MRLIRLSGLDRFLAASHAMPCHAFLSSLTNALGLLDNGGPSERVERVEQSVGRTCQNNLELGMPCSARMARRVPRRAAKQLRAASRTRKSPFFSTLFLDRVESRKTWERPRDRNLETPASDNNAQTFLLGAKPQIPVFPIEQFMLLAAFEATCFQRCTARKEGRREGVSVSEGKIARLVICVPTE